MINDLTTAYPDTKIFTRKQVEEALVGTYKKGQVKKFIENDMNRVGFGKYSLPVQESEVPAKSELTLATAVGSVSNEDVYIPDVDPNYVSWGHSGDVKKLIGSGEFFPVFITGLSGNGKTAMVEQAVAKAKREYVRVQITPETDEDDLIGGFRLIDGNTVFFKGPVIRAMEAGAVLLIDEIDRGSNKLMALQGILEGKPVLIKKTGEVVKPAAGFTVIATANTKGRGDEAGRFSAATIVDEAFLERFNITMEQGWPTEVTEKKILTGVMIEPSEVFISKLVDWANVVRKTYADEAIDEVISTRRLIHIVKTYEIFKDRMKAIKLCINRFDDETRDVLLDLYTKVDADALPTDQVDVSL